MAPIRSIFDRTAQADGARLLAAGAIIAAPTDTVYGVMCRYDLADALARLYHVKERPPEKAIPVLVAGIEQAQLMIDGPLSRRVRALMKRFWPGALTIVAPAHPALPRRLTAGQATVALRMPDHSALLALLDQSGPLAATSANLSGSPAANSAQEVQTQLGDRIDLILADDASADRHQVAASTIVSCAEDGAFSILRRGDLADSVHAFLEADRAAGPGPE